MRKLARSQMRSWALRQLKEQGGLCPLCAKPIDHTIPKEVVVDHDHDTGEVRGVLHRSCNAAEGKTANAIGHWGSKSMKYEDIIPFAERLLAYWKKPGLGVIYPTHKTEEEKRLDRNKKAREQRAARKAKVAVALAARKERVNAGCSS